MLPLDFGGLALVLQRFGGIFGLLQGRVVGAAQLGKLVLQALDAAAVVGKRGLSMLLLLLFEREFAFQAAYLVVLALVVVLAGLLGGF